MTSTWDDTPLFKSLNNLRRHMTGCYECRAAEKNGDLKNACNEGAILAWAVARGFSQLINLKRNAVAVGANTCYPCPDISKHGKAWAMAVPLYHVTGVQEELF